MSNLKAIIVDDDEIDRYVARRLLEKSGMFDTIVECNDGTEIDKLLKDKAGFDRRFGPRPPATLIFLDINMPRMNGFEVLDAMRDIQNAGTLDFSHDCLVFMVSTSDSPDDQDKAADSGLVKDYLVKPITEENLNAVLGKWYANLPPNPETKLDVAEPLPH